jgi:sensor histidine kinase regulating citrate/malate metabolism
MNIEVKIMLSKHFFDLKTEELFKTLSESSVNKHKGTIDVVSVEGKGTTVTVNLPAGE